MLYRSSRSICYRVVANFLGYLRSSHFLGERILWRERIASRPGSQAVVKMIPVLPDTTSLTFVMIIYFCEKRRLITLYESVVACRRILCTLLTPTIILPFILSPFQRSPNTFRDCNNNNTPNIYNRESSTHIRCSQIIYE